MEAHPKGTKVKMIKTDFPAKVPNGSTGVIVEKRIRSTFNRIIFVIL